MSAPHLNAAGSCDVMNWGQAHVLVINGNVASYFGRMSRISLRCAGTIEQGMYRFAGVALQEGDK